MKPGNQKDKKRFKDTKVGQWVSIHAPKVLDAVGDVLPDKGVLGVVKNLIDNEPDLTAEQKIEFERLLMEQERVAQENITARWEADSSSDERLPS